ncbi:DUF1361 domain-containing protein [Flavobacterium caeni]|uniref:Uncharacterized membrane protein n=1 Tax=Flavobacterium caeni TaxID=490189 RepID=A0A1G5B4B6_9FLAO|nr:DUF1361 domain-containing protein [Flavobacterium caeni]SCX84977.1 Uncharacterized membrane protein [Flavobacterium caeni]
MIQILSRWHTRQHALLTLALFNGSLLALRMAVTQSLFYGFLVWNLILAAIPYLVTWYLGENPILATKKRVLLAFSAVWLLFLPNAPYLITDFLHFRRETDMPEWFDILLLMAFAWNGLALAFCSMDAMQQFWARVWGVSTAWGMMLACCMLSGFGIYLGRFLRYNSWDLLCHPWDLLGDVTPLVLERESIGFSIGYGVFFFLSYGIADARKNNQS